MNNLIGKALTNRCFHNPIFIVGASRSGTSVLLRAIGKHPMILSMSGEAPFITSIGGCAYYFEFGDARDYYLKSLKFSKEYLYEYLRRLCFEYAAGKNYGLKLIVKGLLGRDISYLKKRYWCAKTFPDYKVSKGLMRLYPKVKFIYIIRNGCDVVQSRTKFSGFRQQAFEEQCRGWVRSMKNFRYLLSLESAIEVRHEQLVTRPEELFQNIFNFLGVENHEGPVNYVRNNIVHPLEKPTQGAINVEKFFSERKPSYESWSPEQREIFKRICGGSMREAGYAMPLSED